MSLEIGYHTAHRTRPYTSGLLPRAMCLLAIFFLAACGGGGGRPGYTSAQQQAGDFTITLEQPQKIALLENYELFVTVQDMAGKPVDGATVSLEQDMPAMPMNSNQPLGEPIGNGQYRITGVFTMEGDWVLKINVAVAGKQATATFEQPVAPQS